MNFQVRHRRPPVDQLYGVFAKDMRAGDRFPREARDRVAYVYVTGQFPSHLRKTYTGVLRAVTSYFRKPVAMDGRSGHLKLDDRVVQDLKLDRHPMVRKVREHIRQGWLIQPSLGV